MQGMSDISRNVINQCIHIFQSAVIQNSLSQTQGLLGTSYWTKCSWSNQGIHYGKCTFGKFCPSFCLYYNTMHVMIVRNDHWCVTYCSQSDPYSQKAGLNRCHIFVHIQINCVSQLKIVDFFRSAWNVTSYIHLRDYKLQATICCIHIFILSLLSVKNACKCSPLPRVILYLPHQTRPNIVKWIVSSHA
jgi:hypothetical protein